MTDTDPHAPPRRLTRSAHDRMVAGVCGGLADYTGLDPVIFRVTFAVATVFGGAGLLAYALAWLIIPEESQDSNRATTLLRDHDPGRVALYIIGALVLVAVVGPFGGLFGHHWGGGGFGVFVLVGLGVWFWRHERNERDDTDRGPVRQVPPVPAVAHETTDPTVTASIPTPAPPRPRRRTRPRERSRLLAATSSAVVLAVGVLTTIQVAGWAHVDVDTALAVCLLVVGGGLLVGALYGRSRVLIALGLVLALAAGVASVTGLSLRGGTGNRQWRPIGTTDLERNYRLGVGLGELDLRDFDLGAGTRYVDASVGAGTLRVTLPRTGGVHVHVHTGIGDAVVLDHRVSGVDVDSRTRIGSPTDRGLVLDLHVGIGHLEVLR
jgi:phage shock protein PspC (stress-responsive transcriptional regulator)